jgi:hypothetical protein
MGGIPGWLAPYDLYPIPFANEHNPQAIAVGDVTADGWPDIVVADDLRGLVVLANTRNPTPPLPTWRCQDPLDDDERERDQRVRQDRRQEDSLRLHRPRRAASGRASGVRRRRVSPTWRRIRAMPVRRPSLARDRRPGVDRIGLRGSETRDWTRPSSNASPVWRQGDAPQASPPASGAGGRHVAAAGGRRDLDAGVADAGLLTFDDAPRRGPASVPGSPEGRAAGRPIGLERDP